MSKITVTTIAGQSSGSDANKVKIESGDTLESSTIGTASGAMSIKPAGTEVVNVGTTGDILVKGTTNQRAALVLRAGSNTANSQLRFGDQASDTTGRIMYDHSDDTMRFQTNGSERVRISAAGLAIGGTGAANTLNDYEEGQWTPNIQNQGSTSNWSTKKGDYIKIGRVVHCWFVCDHGNSNSGSGTAVLELLGLPFNVAVESTSGSTFAHNSTQSVGMWSANPSSQVGNIFTAGSATQFLLYKGGTSAATQLSFVTGSFSYISTS